MMDTNPPRYNGFVHGGWRRGAVVALFASLCCLTFAAPAHADEQIDVGPSPVLNVNVTRGQVTIQTWDRPQVLISSENPVDVQHLAPSSVDPGIPRQMQMQSHRIQTANGEVTLPAESFVLPELPGAHHDAIVARGNGNMIIMIPRGTAMVMAHLRAGHLTLNNYHGVFVTHVRAAAISLNNVSGTGYVESLRGRIVATNSSFDRLRVRTATGNMLFQACTSHQIQATSTYGSIVYDNGDFQPGLARFESEHGNVALGVRGNAQIGAHSGSGHVVSSFRDQAQVRGDPMTKQATVGNGGPVVTATSKNGSVYLYSGSMNEHPHVREELSGSTRLPMRLQSPPQNGAPPHPPVHAGRPPC
jgi:Putative adhesin